MAKLEKYMKVTENCQIPGSMQAMVLSGAGEENLKLETVEVPECGDGQLFARADAVIACASDIKLIDQCQEHPLMYGWDVLKHPIIVGHKGAVTIIKVGKKRKNTALAPYCIKALIDRTRNCFVKRFFFISGPLKCSTLT